MNVGRAALTTNKTARRHQRVKVEQLHFDSFQTVQKKMKDRKTTKQTQQNINMYAFQTANLPVMLKKEWAEVNV